MPTSQNIFFQHLQANNPGNNCHLDAIRSDIPMPRKDGWQICKFVDISIGPQDRGGSREPGQ